MFYSQNTHQNSIPIVPVHCQEYAQWIKRQPVFAQNILALQNFSAKDGEFVQLPTDKGELACVVLGVDEETEIRWCLGGLVQYLPDGYYHLKCDWSQGQILQAALGWGLGQYQFDNFKSMPAAAANKHLFVPDQQALNAYLEGVTLIRDLINTPANAMMPEDLSQVAFSLAEKYKAKFIDISDRNIMELEYPSIYMVGKASVHNPRMIKLEWGDPSNPELALVGKGVCYDTGGLDIKPSKFMRNMKKDMGGAAHVLGMASIIMALDLPVYLKVYVPAADNAISGEAFRPGDVLKTRLGKTVEIDNTDAEGRLLLCDALTEAAESNPALIVDFATLTGAARVALGTEVPVYFTNSIEDEYLLRQSALDAEELIWALPLHKGYKSQLDSGVADMMNCSQAGYGGAITAALYLHEFLPNSQKWVHFDVMAWNIRHRSGRPVGGEAMGVFATLDYLWKKFDRK